jgi:hypothetical protein
MFASKDLFFSKPSGYQISRSVRTRASATAYFNRTPSVAGNQQKFTWSSWVKLGTLASNITLFSTNVAPSARFQIGTSSNALNVAYNDGASWVLDVVTTAVYRDPSAWYHIVIYVDTTQATATNRVIIYVNGISYSYTGTNCPLNLSTNVNTAVSHSIGRLGNGTAYLDGYITEVNFIDGQALTPSSFGQTNTITGVWQPLKYTGTYGTNGFYLNFSDNSNNTAATIGKDYSGNGNNWTPNNISVTAGTTYDSMLDVPTLFADGGNGRGNYCVINPLDKSSSGTIADGNLATSSQVASCHGSISPNSGKWYFEASFSSITGVSSLVEVGLESSSQIQGYLSSGNKDLDTTQTAYGATYTTSDIIGCAFDLDAKQMTFYKNNTSQGTFTYTVADTYFPMIRARGTTTFAGTINFGQRPFTYTPPTGFVALNTQNLPTPSISNGANYMAATTYSGDGTNPRTITNSVNNIGFQPDFIWAKVRSTTYSNTLYDSVRGGANALFSDTTSAESTNYANGQILAFNSNGFNVNAGVVLNQSGQTYVTWQWKAGGTSSSNTNGSITSTVSVGATQGFSVVTYTGNGTAGATVGHGLGVAPSMMIVKSRTQGTTGYTGAWYVYHTTTGASNALLLNTTDASTVTGAWNSTAPTSSVFSLGTISQVNRNTDSYVAYLFSQVAGYSKFGSYTGNGSTDGPFVFCGFRPRFILWKRTDAIADWGVIDTTRDTYNTTGYDLTPNASAAEGTGYTVDFLSNGFKIRLTATRINASAGTYIFAAFAENPYKLSLAR